jgi:Golgi phosphoprotein 3 GPP34
MDELGDDLLLLAVRPGGTLTTPPKLRFGLSGSGLVRLAATRRVDIVRGRIAILDTAPTGDALLDEALASMTPGRRGEPTAKAWVARNRPGLTERYLARAEAAGIIRAQRYKALGFIPMTRWTVLDTARAAAGAADASQAAQRAATDAATRAAMDAAVRTATDAAVSAGVDAATQAAVSAATDAGHHGGHGGAVGGHH